MPDLQRISAETAVSEGIRCAFCGRTPAEGSDLVAANDTAICDECVAGCADVLSVPVAADDDQQSAEERNERDDCDVEAPAGQQTFFRVLSEADVAGLIEMDDLIDAVGTILARFSAGDLELPARTRLTLNGRRDLFSVMPAYVQATGDEPSVLGAKVATDFANNAVLELPTRLETVLLFSAETGALLAVVGGRYLAEARTAAVSALSARLLAREDAGRLAILGSGALARRHVEALEHVFELSRVRVWSPVPEQQLALIEELESTTGTPVEGAGSAEDAVRAADLVVVATSSSEPVVRQEWVKEGAHVMNAAACGPDQRELDPALVRRGRLFVDARADALTEYGDLVLGVREHVLSGSSIVGELGQVVARAIEGRRSPRDVTIFKSVGLAVEDVVAADRVYRLALTADVGQELEL